jgi:hypothetical protein
MLELQSLLAEYNALKDQCVVQLNLMLAHCHVKASIENHCGYLAAAIHTG